MAISQNLVAVLRYGLDMRWSTLILCLFALLPAGRSDAALAYQLTLSDDARRLEVAICTDTELSAGVWSSGDRDAAENVDQLVGDGSSAPRLARGRLRFDGLSRGACLHYWVDAYAAAQSDRYGLSWRQGHYVMLPLSAWLWRPERLPEGSTLALQLPAGWSASLPFARSSKTSQTYLLSQTSTWWPGSAVFGRFDETVLAAPGGQVRVTVLPTASNRRPERLISWIQANVKAALSSSGRLPLSDFQLLVVPLPGAGSPVPWGQVQRGGATALKLFVRSGASDAALMDDWTLAHELSHTFHPYLRDEGRWLSEGLASYYQNVLRARSGMLTAEQAWAKLDAGFGRGLANRSSAGQPLSDAADSYRSTMRVYWSGAAYWLEAELALLQRGGLSLEQVLEQFARFHLPATRRWSPEEFVQTLDGLADADLFAPMYRRYAGSKSFPLLTEVYRDFGLGERIGRLQLSDDRAEKALRQWVMQMPRRLAEVRREIVVQPRAQDDGAGGSD